MSQAALRATSCVKERHRLAGTRTMSTKQFVVTQAIDVALARIEVPLTGIPLGQRQLGTSGASPPRDLQAELQALREEMFRIWEDSSP